MSNRMINLIAFGILTLLWLGFLAGLIFNPQLLDSTWAAFRSWPLLVQIIVGLLVLPVAAGLWIWETTWPIWLRLILVAGLAWATIYLFFPRRTAAAQEPSSSKG